MSFKEARARILDALQKDLLGPGSERLSGTNVEEEIITEMPTDRYSIGILYSQEEESPEEKTVFEAAGEKDDEREEEDTAETQGGTPEEPVIEKKDQSSDNSEDDDSPITTTFKPSSMGLSFYYEGNGTDLEITIKGAFYSSIKRSEINACKVNVECIGLEVSPDDEAALHIHGFVIEHGTLRFADDFRLKDEHLKTNPLLSHLKAQLQIIAPHVEPSIRASTPPILDAKASLDSLITRRNLQIKHLQSDNRDIQAMIERVRVINLIYIATSRLLTQALYGFRRQPVIAGPINISELLDKKSMTIASQAAGEIVLVGKLRTPPEANGPKLVTISLINKCTGKGFESFFYQPDIRVNSPSGAITTYSERATSRDDLESLCYEMLYRNRRPFAKGHGCSVEWNSVTTTSANELWTTFIPLHEVPRIATDISRNCSNSKTSHELQQALKMEALADMDAWATSRQHLASFVSMYESWVEDLSKSDLNASEHYAEAAATNVRNCRIAAQRMRKGLELLDANDTAREAFCLANRAMALVRRQTELQKQSPYDPEKAAWRPFQLAFLLLCVDPTINENSEYREVVDLIWFPTGGGKTEAYLGLAAFTIFNRRLKGSTDPKAASATGTTILMRYTLRLLTAQQFQRASVLICACEHLRRKDTRLGKTPISIGLWVGGGHDGIPNSFGEARQKVSELRKAHSKGNTWTQQNVFHVLNCPWCGESLDRRHDESWLDPEKLGYNATSTSFNISCLNKKCEFRTSPLPVQVIDEGLYRNPPTLLFSTVDKFANLPWKPETAAFFGIRTKSCSIESAPPSIIIQDELHLISHELGTIVALYEAAIQELCSRNGIRPKIVASTATARNATKQCRVLFNAKDTSIFPPPGLDISDSFFAREDNESPGRLYAGLMSSGKSYTTIELLVEASLLQRVYSMDGLSMAERDQYFTLVSYFNSIKDLGAAETYMAGRVRDLVKRIADREVLPRRNLREIARLYSGVKHYEIPRTLERLQKVAFPTEGAVDAVLASNMLSVGIDVDRFGLMFMKGPPKTTSEYIQATSRVGRLNPGLVVTLYDGGRPRDRSLFEVYKDFTQSFYRYVEPTSLTPFTKAARDKGLHAILVTLVRHLLPALRDDPNTLPQYHDEIESIGRRIVDWVDGADPSEKEATILHLSDIIASWNQWIGEVDGVDKYGTVTLSGTMLNSLLYQPGSDRNKGYETLTSMRSVDTPCNLNVHERED